MYFLNTERVTMSKQKFDHFGNTFVPSRLAACGSLLPVYGRDAIVFVSYAVTMNISATAKNATATMIFIVVVRSCTWCGRYTL
jgi:hypothetical protein